MSLEHSCTLGDRLALYRPAQWTLTEESRSTRSTEDINVELSSTIKPSKITNSITVPYGQISLEKARNIVASPLHVPLSKST